MVFCHSSRPSLDRCSAFRLVFRRFVIAPQEVSSDPSLGQFAEEQRRYRATEGLPIIQAIWSRAATERRPGFVVARQAFIVKIRPNCDRRAAVTAATRASIYHISNLISSFALFLASPTSHSNRSLSQCLIPQPITLADGEKEDFQERRINEPGHLPQFRSQGKRISCAPGSPLGGPWHATAVDQQNTINSLSTALAGPTAGTALALFRRIMASCGDRPSWDQEHHDAAVRRALEEHIETEKNERPRSPNSFGTTLSIFGIYSRRIVASSFSSP